MSTVKRFEPFKEYRHTGDFEPDAQKAYKIVRGLRLLGWIFLLSLSLGAVSVIAYDKLKPVVAKSKIEFRRVAPAKTNSSTDPIFRILSEQG